jgi:hypothetical protein
MRLTRSRVPALALMALAAGALPATAATLPAQDAFATDAPSRSAAELERLVAPVALYPDPLLAQLFLAATFPDQVMEAAAWVRSNGQQGLDEQWWDVSVRAVAHYPTVLNRMDRDPSWTRALGEAYAAQSADVMAAVQRLRRQANDNGNLATNAQQQVVVERDVIEVWPAQPNVIYVPVYDPRVVYVVPARAALRPVVTFGIGFPLGAWCVYDWDWPARRIVFTGWVGGGWVARARPYVTVSAFYAPPRYRYGYREPVIASWPGRHLGWEKQRERYDRDRFEHERFERARDERERFERAERERYDRDRFDRGGWDRDRVTAVPRARLDRDRGYTPAWGNGDRGNRGGGDRTWNPAPQPQPQFQPPPQRGGSNNGRGDARGIELGDLPHGPPPMIARSRGEGDRRGGEHGDRGNGERGNRGHGG